MMRRRLRALLLICLALAASTAWTQTRIYGPGSNPRELTSIAWNTALSIFEGWNGSSWQALVSSPVTHAATYTVDGVLTAETGQLRWYPPAACTLVSVFAAVGTAPTGSSIQVDVNKTGVSVLASPLSIAAGANTSSVTTPTTTAMATTDYLTVDVDSIGSTEPGRDLTVRIIYTIP